MKGVLLITGSSWPLLFQTEDSGLQGKTLTDSDGNWAFPSNQRAADAIMPLF